VKCVKGGRARARRPSAVIQMALAASQAQSSQVSPLRVDVSAVCVSEVPLCRRFVCGKPPSMGRSYASCQVLSVSWQQASHHRHSQRQQSKPTTNEQGCPRLPALLPCRDIPVLRATWPALRGGDTTTARPDPGLRPAASQSVHNSDGRRPVLTTLGRRANHYVSAPVASSFATLPPGVAVFVLQKCVVGNRCRTTQTPGVSQYTTQQAVHNSDGSHPPRWMAISHNVESTACERLLPPALPPCRRLCGQKCGVAARCRTTQFSQ